MSIGYVPKQRAKAKRMRNLRKKYKNFSCYTCEKSHNLTCRKRYQSRRIGGIIVTYYENCPQWKADKNYTTPQNLNPSTSQAKKTSSRRK